MAIITPISVDLIVAWWQRILEVHMGVAMIVITSDSASWVLFQCFYMVVEHLFQSDSVPGVGSEKRICDIAQEGSKTDKEVKHNVRDHNCSQLTTVFSWRHCHRRVHNHERHEHIDEVADRRKKAYNGAPAGPYTAYVDCVG